MGQDRLLNLFVGFNILYFSMFILGFPGDAETLLRLPAPISYESCDFDCRSWFLAVGLIIIFWNLIRSVVNGEKASMNPWGGKDAGVDDFLPAPKGKNFVELPVITQGPYPYDEKR